MNVKTITALACAAIATAALAGCTASVGGTAGASTAPSPGPSATSIAGAKAVTAHGTGSTVGAKTGHAPTDVTVPLVAGSRSVEVTVSCPGTDVWIVTDVSSSTNRHGTCGQNETALFPLVGGDDSVSIQTLAFTGGKPFTVTGVASTKVYRQDSALATFCSAYSTPASTLFNADQSYQKRLTTAAQWAGSRATGTAQLAPLASASTTPAWARTAVTSIRAAALAASPGSAATADDSDVQRISIRCDNNSSPVTIDVTTPGEG
jgi:hypothetical protein